MNILLKLAVREGRNLITRSSTKSSVSIPFNRTFRDLDIDSKNSDNKKLNLCSCGWPYHMLLPKGKVDGMDCELFVMISNYEYDKVTNCIVL